LNRKIYLYDHVKDAEIWLTPETFPSLAARDEHFAVRRAHASQTDQVVSKVYDRRYGCSEDDRSGSGNLNNGDKWIFSL